MDKYQRKPPIELRFPSAFEELEDLKTRVQLLEKFMLEETDTVYELKTLEDLDELIKDIREQMVKQSVVRVTLER